VHALCVRATITSRAVVMGSARYATHNLSHLNVTGAMQQEFCPLMSPSCLSCARQWRKVNGTEGEMTEGYCVCEGEYAGAYCAACVSGYGGEDCSDKCPLLCSGRGRCDVTRDGLTKVSAHSCNGHSDDHQTENEKCSSEPLPIQRVPDYRYRARRGIRRLIAATVQRAGMTRRTALTVPVGFMAPTVWGCAVTVGPMAGVTAGSRVMGTAPALRVIRAQSAICVTTGECTRPALSDSLHVVPKLRGYSSSWALLHCLAGIPGHRAKMCAWSVQGGTKTHAGRRLPTTPTSNTS
jgi:hypothetical protein